jgi:4-hydroxybenzoate polyprenyltransferase
LGSTRCESARPELIFAAGEIDYVEPGEAEGARPHYGLLRTLPFALVGRPSPPISSRVSAPPTCSGSCWLSPAPGSPRWGSTGSSTGSIDARNPRTRNREIPAGRLSVREAGVAVALASLLFVLSAGMLNLLCLVLAPFALAWIFFYSYTKRFTRWAHLVLGFALAIAPVGAYLAITGSWSDPGVALFVLAGAVLCWVAGFDILYSLQDEEFDRVEGLHSVPAALGPVQAIRVSRLLHFLCVALFLASGFLFQGVGAIYFLGVAMIGAMLVYEQSLVRPDDLSRIDAAFFNINGAISILFCAMVLVERLFT